MGLLDPPALPLSTATSSYLSLARQPSATSARSVIWDTDWWTDVDDVVALRLLCHAERLGLVDIQAIVIDTKLAKGPGSVGAMLEFENRRDVPVGVHASYIPSGTPPYQSNAFDLWPHRADGYWATTLDSTTVYRKALVAAANGSMDIISVGYLTALQDLLQSPADSISALTGAQLVAQKVNKLWVMGGVWPTPNAAENNFGRDTTAAAAASYVVANWPTTITFLGYPVGVNVLTGSLLTGTTATDPLAQALSDHGSLTTGRSSWDPMLTWMACIGDPTRAGYATVQGTASVDASTGVNSWTDSTSGSHYYVYVTAENRWIKDDLNARLYPRVDPPVRYAPGVQTGLIRQGALRKPVTPGFVRSARTTTLASSLLVHLHADDLSDLADTATVSHWDDRMLSKPARQLTSTNRPTKATVSSKACVQFIAGGSPKWMYTDTLYLPATLSVYARVNWAVVPTSNQTVVAGYDNVTFTTTYRHFHLKATNGGTVQAAGFYLANGTTDNAAAITQSTWQTISLRLDAATIEAFVDGVSNGATSRSGQNASVTPLSLGSRNYDASSEQFVGYLREVRVYGVKHDDATVAAVVAAMNA